MYHLPRKKISREAIHSPAFRSRGIPGDRLFYRIPSLTVISRWVPRHYYTYFDCKSQLFGESLQFAGGSLFFCAVNLRYAFIATREAMYEPLCYRHPPIMGRRAKSLTAHPDARGKHLCAYNIVACNCSTLINMQRICMPPLF